MELRGGLAAFCKFHWRQSLDILTQILSAGDMYINV